MVEKIAKCRWKFMICRRCPRGCWESFGVVCFRFELSEPSLQAVRAETMVDGLPRATRLAAFVSDEVVRSTLLCLSGRIWKLGCSPQIWALAHNIPIFNIINGSNHMHRGVGYSLFDPVNPDSPLLSLGDFIY